jgi:hypothetical protein
VTVSEAIGLALPEPGALAISVTDAVAISEQAVIQPLVILVTVLETIGIGESALLSGITTGSVGAVVRSAQEMIPAPRSSQAMSPTITGANEL